MDKGYKVSLKKNAKFKAALHTAACGGVWFGVQLPQENIPVLAILETKSSMLYFPRRHTSVYILALFLDMYWIICAVLVYDYNINRNIVRLWMHCQSILYYVRLYPNLLLQICNLSMHNKNYCLSGLVHDKLHREHKDLWPSVPDGWSLIYR